MLRSGAFVAYGVPAWLRRRMPHMPHMLCSGWSAKIEGICCTRSSARRMSTGGWKPLSRYAPRYPCLLTWWNTVERVPACATERPLALLRAPPIEGRERGTRAMRARAMCAEHALNWEIAAGRPGPGSPAVLVQYS